MPRKGKRNKVINHDNTFTYVDAEAFSLAIADALEKQLKALQEQEEAQEER